MPILGPGVTHIPSSKTDNAFLIDSPGHIALLHEPTRTVLAGDAVFHTGKLGYGPPTFAADPADPAAGAEWIPTDITAAFRGAARVTHCARHV
jgi:hypothetical protein